MPSFEFGLPPDFEAAVPGSFTEFRETQFGLPPDFEAAVPPVSLRASLICHTRRGVIAAAASI
jgi:hypothetical protein